MNSTIVQSNLHRLSGNVIGGGDTKKDRIIPDLVKSINSKRIYL